MRRSAIPTRDPHGDPIPTADLVLVPDERTLLCDVAEGDQAVVRRVPDSDADLLRYLASLGLVPERELVVVEQAPFDGPVTVEVAGDPSRNRPKRRRTDRGAAP